MGTDCTGQPDPMIPPQCVTDGRLGVLLHSDSGGMDALLHGAIERIRACGLSVGGLVQRAGEPLSNGKHQVWVDDIATGRSIRLDSPRGRGASACILDPDALAQAACLLRRSIEMRPALIIVNRFGHAEANGGGMRPEIADALCSGAAVLISARRSYRSALEAFLGASPALLPPSVVAIAEWAERAAALGQQEIAG